MTRDPSTGRPQFFSRMRMFFAVLSTDFFNCRAAINPVQNNRIADKLPFGMFQLTKTMLREIADETDLTFSLIHVIGDS